jgi:Bax protein
MTCAYTHARQIITIFLFTKEIKHMHINKTSNYLFSLFIILSTLSFNTNADIPDFASIKNVKQKKQAFFKYMYPLIISENKNILAERKKIIQLQKKIAKQALSANEHKFLRTISAKYSLKTQNPSSQKNITKLLTHVDYVPPALILSQSANESAWGTSRFAKQANNFFGQWCFKKGCGLIPLHRNSGSKHEVRKFSSPQNSIRSYIRNINTGRAYASLRKLRAKNHNNKSLITGYDLAIGLIKYSQRGIAYIKEIRSMIRINKLTRYDQKFWNKNIVEKRV